MKYEFPSGISKDISGVSFDVMEFTIDIYDITVQQHYYAKKVNDYVLKFILRFSV